MKSAAGVGGLKTGNPALYCNPECADTEAATGGVPPTAQEEPVKAAPSSSTAAPKAAAAAPKLDASTFDIVKATQYGARERVELLVEGGFDVNQRDEENVTLLHWAAINNRGAKPETNSRPPFDQKFTTCKSANAMYESPMSTYVLDSKEYRYTKPGRAVLDRKCL